MRLSLATLALLLASDVAAQTATLTSPKGLDNKEGNTVFYNWGGASGRRFQSIDNTNSGKPFVARKLALRRNGGGGGTGAGARTMDMTLTMAQTNFALVYGLFDLNLVSNKKVVLKKKVNFPNWTANAGSPAPFDWVMTFGSPWVYTGQGALVWDAHYVNPSVTSLAQTDRDYRFPTSRVASAVGAGCGGFTHQMQLQNNGPAVSSFGMRIVWSGSNARANSPLLLFLDFQDRNLTVPGLCSELHALTSFFALGTTDGNGAVPWTYLSFPYISGLQGATFVTQLVVLDPSQAGLKWAVSNGRVATMPSSSATTGHAACYISASNPRTGGVVFVGGTMVAQLSI